MAMMYVDTAKFAKLQAERDKVSALQRKAAPKKKRKAAKETA